LHKTNRHKKVYRGTQTHNLDIVQKWVVGFRHSVNVIQYVMGEENRTILYILFCLVVYLERESINPRRKYINISNEKLIHQSKKMLTLVSVYPL
jgi:hypothetical protein